VAGEDVGTWYKHREWKPNEEKKDFKPVQLEAKKDPDEKKKGSGSAWNAAGTWEEKNTMPWWHNKLSQLEGMGDAPTVTIEKVEDVSGEASIVHTRGVPKFMYDIKAEMRFSGLQRCKACSKSSSDCRCSNCVRILGKLLLKELSWDCEDSIGLEVKALEPPGPSHVKKAGQKECQEFLDSAFGDAVRNYLRTCVEDYKGLVESAPNPKWKSQLPPKSESGWEGLTTTTPQRLDEQQPESTTTTTTTGNKE